MIYYLYYTTDYGKTWIKIPELISSNNINNIKIIYQLDNEKIIFIEEAIDYLLDIYYPEDEDGNSWVMSTLYLPDGVRIKEVEKVEFRDFYRGQITMQCIKDSEKVEMEFVTVDGGYTWSSREKGEK